MTGEMEETLTELPKYTAYAKILRGGNIWKGKLRTLRIPEEPKDPPVFRLMCPLELWAKKRRSQIEEDIQSRQTKWRPAIIQLPDVSPEKPTITKKQEEEPPPTRY